MSLVAVHFICPNCINEISTEWFLFCFALPFSSHSKEMLAINLGQVKQYRMYFFGLSMTGSWILGKFILSFLLGIPVLKYDGKSLRIEREN